LWAAAYRDHFLQDPPSQMRIDRFKSLEEIGRTKERKKVLAYSQDPTP
jgi:hypothetical protein